MSFLKFPEWTKFNFGNKRVFMFQEGCLDDFVGFGVKGANLCEMVCLKLPIPPGFIITAESCVEHAPMAILESTDSNNVKSNFICQTLISEYEKAINIIEKKTGQSFGGNTTEVFPLLLSVRCSTYMPIPYLMKTILNLGMNDEVVTTIIKLTNNPYFAYNCYRQFLQMFGISVYGINKLKYDSIIEKIKNQRKHIFNHNNNKTKKEIFNINELQQIIEEFKLLVSIPNNPQDQLRLAIESVYKSYYSINSKIFRECHEISHGIGTAIIIQTMVFGEMNPRSCYGICFTRHPSSGMQGLVGEYVIHTEGLKSVIPLEELRDALPSAYAVLKRSQTVLELHYRDMQMLDFAIENGNLFILSTTSAMRTPKAALRVAITLVQEGTISPADALVRIRASQVAASCIGQLVVDVPSASSACPVIGRGLASSPGAARGCILVGRTTGCTAPRDRSCRRCPSSVLLLIDETGLEHYAEDISQGVFVALLLVESGFSSRAAGLARSAGIPAISQLRPESGDHLPPAYLRDGVMVTVDGCRGLVFQGEMALARSSPCSGDLRQLLSWADSYRRMKVYGAVTDWTVETIAADGVWLNDSVVEGWDQARMLSILRTHGRLFVRLCSPTAADGAIAAVFAAVDAHNTLKNLDEFVEFIIPFCLSDVALKAADGRISRLAAATSCRTGRRARYGLVLMLQTPYSLLVAQQTAVRLRNTEAMSWAVCIDLDAITRLVYGFTAFDVATLIPVYRERAVLHCDPLRVLDWQGVGVLVREAVRLHRSCGLLVGISGVCSEDPAALQWLRPDWLVVQGGRVAAAKVAAAQAILSSVEGREARENADFWHLLGQARAIAPF